MHTRNLLMAILAICLVLLGMLIRKKAGDDYSQLSKTAVSTLDALQIRANSLSDRKIASYQNKSQLGKTIVKSANENRVDSYDSDDQEDQPAFHDHRDCLSAIQRAMESSSFDHSVPQLSEQELFDLIVNHPQLGPMLEHYEKFMIDEKGEEILRSQAAEDFEQEIAELEASDGVIETVSF